MSDPLRNCIGWFDASNAGHDIFRRVYMLNQARPVTRWRRLRARMGWHERDTWRSGFTHKPKIAKIAKSAIEFDGTNTMSPLRYADLTVYACSIGHPLVGRLWWMRRWGFIVAPDIDGFVYIGGPFYWKR